MSDEKFHTRKLVDPNAAQLHQTGMLPTPAGEEDVVPWVLEFRVVGTPYIIKQTVKEQMLIGRKDEKGGIFPELDLGPYDGLGHGVSRQHALLQARDNRITLQDLGSANGTYINGNVLERGKAFRVREGDMIFIGKMQLQVNFVLKPLINEKTTIGMNYLSPEKIGSGETVLVVDDDEYLGKVIVTTLKQAGFKPIIVHSGVQAISKIDEQLPDIAIVELDLQDVSGLDVYRYLKKKSGRSIPTIGISAATAGFIMGQALDEGMEFFLGKPLALEELTRSLDKIVQQFV